jgi:hypothetical protein
MPRRPRTGPGPGSVAIEIFAPGVSSAKWDRAAWDGAPWTTLAWQRVDCDVTEAVYRYGVTDETGILSAPDAGPCDLSTFDPNRSLDPSNETGPYFTYIGPGTPVRITKVGATSIPAWSGFIDEVSYDVASMRGRIRAVDAVAYVAQADVPAGTVLPNTLRARVRAVIAATGLTGIVPVQPDTDTRQLLLDTSFENAALPNWTPFAVGAGSGSVVGTVPLNGSRVLKIVGGAGAGAQYYQTVAAEPGGVYTLAGYTRWAAGAGLKGSLSIAALNAAGGLVVNPTVTSTLADPNAWDPLTVSYTVPTDGSVAYLRAVCTISGATTAADQPLFEDVTLTGPVAGSSLPPDPPVAAYDGQERSAWSAILDAAQDALVFVWLDATGTLKFTSWGGFPDANVSLGCGPVDEGPWVEAIETIEYVATAAGIWNQVRAWVSANTNTAVVADPASVARYGGRLFAADRIVPSFSVWAGRILADRAGAGLSVDIGAARPQSEAELDLLLGIGGGGPQVVRVRDDDHGPVIDRDVSTIGATVRVTEVGWVFDFVTTIPRVEWDAVDPTPPIPPDPPPNPYHPESRVYVATSDALIALTSGGAQYGAGASTSLPVGSWSGWQYRGLVQFPSIPWANVRAIRKATLRVTTSTQVRIGFGSSPTIEVRRITGSWSAGSSSSPSGGNAVVWPGPATTTSGAVRKDVTKSQSTAVDIDVTAIVKAWGPSSVGGSSAAQRGVALYGGSGSTADTTEFWPVEQGGASRPQLTLDLDVFD